MDDVARKLEPKGLSSLSDGTEPRSSESRAPTPQPQRRAPRPRGLWRRIVALERGTVIGLAVFAVLLLAARVALPFVVKHVINERLAELEGYTGRVDDVDISRIRFLVQVFSNWKHDRLAVVVPVSGSFSSPQTDGWAIVGSVLYNMIIRAIRHGLDNQDGWRPDGELTRDG